MAQVPECVVCLQQYDDHLHVPRVLACGHSLCEPCLMQLQSAWQPSPDKSKAFQAAGAMIRCPECSQRTRVPVGGCQSLPKNVELLRLLPSLVKEAGSTDEGRIVTEENPGGSREGNEDARASSQSKAKESVMESKRSGGRKLNIKGKEAVGSDCTSGRVSCSTVRWLVPCDLYSENVVGDIRAWILPESAVRLRENCSICAPVKKFERQLLCAEVNLENTRLSSSVPVTLVRLECSPPQDETASYNLCVQKAWEVLRYDIKIELLMLFRVSLLCRRLCKLLGVWMNKRKELFLVSEIPSHETPSAWEMIMKAGQIEDSSDIKFEDLKCNCVTGQSASNGDDNTRLTGGMPQPDFHKGPLRIMPSAATTDLLTRVGLGLCEVLLEAQSQGLILGTLSPNGLVLDRFGTLLFQLNTALNERFSVHAVIASHQNLFDIGLTLEGHGSQAVDEQFEPEFPRNCWQYVSPEVLSLLITNVADSEGSHSTAGNCKNASDELHGPITCKSDVWSLGCLLLEIVSGQAPFDGLTFHEVLEMVLVKREKPAAFWSLDYSLDHGANCQVCMDIEKHKHIQSFRILLSKCFEYDPGKRPGLHEIWLNLMELALPNSVAKLNFIGHQPNKSTSSFGQKFWILCLPGFVLDGYLDSWLGKRADLQDSHKRLELLQLQNGTSDDGKELRSFGLELNECLEGHQDFVTALAVCGDHLLSASFDKTVRVWSLEDHQLQQTLEGHSHVVAALAVDHDTSRCFSGDSNGKICVWMIGEGVSQPLTATWQEHKNWRYTGVACLAVSGDGILYSGSGDRTVKAWSLQNFALIGTMEGHKSLVSALLVDGELLYSGSWDGTIHVWWRSDHSPVAVLGDTAVIPSLGGVRTLWMSDSFLFAGHDNGAIQVWRDEECLKTVKAHDMVVSTLYVQGDLLYSASWDQKIKVWKVDEFLLDPSPALVKECGSALSSIISDGDRLYAGLADRAIMVFAFLRNGSGF